LILYHHNEWDEGNWTCFEKISKNNGTFKATILKKSHLNYMTILRWMIGLLFLICPFRTNACFICFYTDGTNVLVANHEDWIRKDGAIKINPPGNGRYGSIIFTFLSEGWAQGGMNERGLFFDTARTPYAEAIVDAAAKTPAAFIWQTMLDKAATVDEALTLLQQYALPELNETSVMLADASGKAVIIGVHNHKLATRFVSGSHLTQTNFNLWHPELSETPGCSRYEFAEEYLEKKPPANVESMLAILQKTHQDSLTIYSNIYDLKNKIVYTYNKRNFAQPIITSLPAFFSYGACMLSLDSLQQDPTFWQRCEPTRSLAFKIRGTVLDDQTGEPLPYVNIGLLERNVGTLSDPDGSFEMEIPPSYRKDSLIFSMVGYETKRSDISSWASNSVTIHLKSKSILLKEITISDKKISSKHARLGWMGGKDGVIPLDTVQGGGAVALLVESPSTPFYLDKLQVRLMYNSKDTLQMRFHVFEFDSIHQRPGRELLTREIILTEYKHFGWLRFDLSAYEIKVNHKKVCIGFEWIDDRETRSGIVAGLREWEAWKAKQFERGNKKVEYVAGSNSTLKGSYKYHGNMMDWPGFKTLPPLAGLMVETGKHDETRSLRTFERKTSFGTWHELESTLNAVITISY
jgi:hypothetical protein